MTIESDKKEARRIHDAVISHYQGVLAHYKDRQTVLRAEIAKWTKRLAELDDDYINAPERIAAAQQAIAELTNAEERAKAAPRSTRKSRFAKILELEAEVARLKRDLK